MTVKDKLNEFLKSKINKFRKVMNKPITISPTAQKAIDFSSNFATSFANAVPGNVTEKITGAMGIPQYNIQSKAGQVGNVAGNVASTMIQGAGLGKAIAPMYKGLTSPLTKAGLNIATKGGIKNKIVGTGLANLSQGLPYTASFNILNKARNPQTSTGKGMAADALFDFATGTLPIVGVAGMTARKGITSNADDIAKAIKKNIPAKKYGSVKFKIADQEGIKEVVGKPIKLIEGIETFVHQGDNPKRTVKGFVVTEKTTGRYMATGETEKEAIANAKKAISDIGEKQVKKIIAEKQLIQNKPADLISEARKYKSAEEFVNRPSGLGEYDYLYHTSPTKNLESIKTQGIKPSGERPIYFAQDLKSATRWGNKGEPIFRVPKNEISVAGSGGALDNPISKEVVSPNKLEVSIDGGKTWNPLLSKSQLTDIWNKAQGVKALKANSRVADTNIRPVQESLPKVSISPQQAGKATTAPIQPKQSLQVQQAGGGGLSGGTKNPSLSGIIPQNDPVQKIISALKKAKPIRGGQEAMYSKARGQKFAKLMSTRGKTGGEAGYFKELGTLKGELPKADFESIRNQLNQGDIDSLFDKVNVANIGEWEKLTAKSGLAKLLGKEGTSVPTKGELAKLNDVFGKEFTQTLLDKRGNWQKLADLAGDVLNLPRSMMASFDLSAPLRQGIFLIGRPKQWGDSFLTMFEAFYSKDAQKSVFENISSRPTYKLMREHRLGLTDPDSILGNKEEMFMSNLAEKIPGIKIGIKASDRAYSTFLNKLRADTFDDIYARGKDLGIADDPEFLKSVASFVNNATGRGELPSALASSAKTLNGLMFSPKLMASRLNLLNPVYYAKLHPTVRKEALKSLLTFAGAGMTVATLASLAGAEVGTDPRNSDFGKVKVGNTRYDIWGGFQQYIKIASQLITGKLISSTTGKEYTLGEGYKPLTRLGILSKFMQSKQSPVVGFVLGLLEGKNAIGDDFKPTQELLDRFIPMVISDMYDLQKEWGPKGLLMGMPAIFGVGSQTYGRQFPVQETIETGKPTIKMRGETGLAEDIVNSVSGTPKTTVPQSQWEDIREKKQSETDLAIARDKVRKSQQMEETDDYYVYFDKDSGETRSIKKNPDLTPPQLTGQKELDKEILSDYKSSLSRRINDIVKLYELGQMSSEEAEKEIAKISVLKEIVSQIGKSSKPKKIRVSRGSIPKTRKTSVKKVSLKTIKRNDKAKFNVKVKKPTTYKVSQADLEKLRTGNV